MLVALNQIKGIFRTLSGFFRCFRIQMLCLSSGRRTANTSAQAGTHPETEGQAGVSVCRYLCVLARQISPAACMPK